MEIVLKLIEEIEAETLKEQVNKVHILVFFLFEFHMFADFSGNATSNWECKRDNCPIRRAHPRFANRNWASESLLLFSFFFVAWLRNLNWWPSFVGHRNKLQVCNQDWVDKSQHMRQKWNNFEMISKLLEWAFGFVLEIRCCQKTLLSWQRNLTTGSCWRRSTRTNRLATKTTNGCTNSPKNSVQSQKASQFWLSSNLTLLFFVVLGFRLMKRTQFMRSRCVRWMGKFRSWEWVKELAVPFFFVLFCLTLIFFFFFNTTKTVCLVHSSHKCCTPNSTKQYFFLKNYLVSFLCDFSFATNKKTAFVSFFKIENFELWNKKKSHKTKLMTTQPTNKAPSHTNAGNTQLQFEEDVLCHNFFQLVLADLPPELLPAELLPQNFYPQNLAQNFAPQNLAPQNLAPELGPRTHNPPQNPQSQETVLKFISDDPLASFASFPSPIHVSLTILSNFLFCSHFSERKSSCWTGKRSCAQAREQGRQAKFVWRWGRVQAVKYEVRLGERVAELWRKKIWKTRATKKALAKKPIFSLRVVATFSSQKTKTNLLQGFFCAKKANSFSNSKSNKIHSFSFFFGSCCWHLSFFSFVLLVTKLTKNNFPLNQPKKKKKSKLFLNLLLGKQKNHFSLLCSKGRSSQKMELITKKSHCFGWKNN